MKHFFIACVVILFFAGCRKTEGEFLFEMVYPNFEFTIPAGLNPGFPYAVVFNDVESNFDFFAAQRQVDTGEVNIINPVFGSLSSLDNLDLDFFSAISVRVCANEGADCKVLADEVYYVEELWNEGEVINLFPSLRNVRQDLSQDRFRLEIVLFLREITPYTVNCRFEMNFEAAR